MMDFHKIKKLMAEKFKEDPDFVYGFPTLAQAGALENCKWWTKNFSRIQSEGFGDFLCLLAAGWWTPKSYNALHSTAKKFSVESLEHAKFAEQNGRGMIRRAKVHQEKRQKNSTVRLSRRCNWTFLHHDEA